MPTSLRTGDPNDRVHARPTTRRSLTMLVTGALAWTCTTSSFAQAPPANAPERARTTVATDPLGGETRENVTTLELDPAKTMPIEGWWIGETHLLEVRRDRGFVLRLGENRFARPVLTGRWRRQSHAVFFLEPYSARLFEPVRVPLSIVSATPALDFPGIGMMLKLTAPPHAPEDDLVGTWNGVGGTMVLTETLRYAWDRSIGGEVRREAGAWRLDAGVLRLVPDSPVVRASALLVRRAAPPERVAGDGTRDEDAADESVITPIVELIGLGGAMRPVDTAAQEARGDAGQPDADPARASISDAASSS